MRIFLCATLLSDTIFCGYKVLTEVILYFCELLHLLYLCVSHLHHRFQNCIYIFHGILNWYVFFNMAVTCARIFVYVNHSQLNFAPKKLISRLLVSSYHHSHTDNIKFRSSDFLPVRITYCRYYCYYPRIFISWINVFLSVMSTVVVTISLSDMQPMFCKEQTLKYIFFN